MAGALCVLSAALGPLAPCELLARQIALFAFRKCAVEQSRLSRLSFHLERLVRNSKVGLKKAVLPFSPILL